MQFPPRDSLGLASESGAHAPLADDNADLRSYVARLPAERGYEVTTAADGEAALDAIRRRRPDLVVTDVMMPQLDRFGLLRAIREDPALRNLPFVVLSARAGEEAKVEGLEAGADDYLAKPLSARELGLNGTAGFLLEYDGSRANLAAADQVADLNFDGVAPAQLPVDREIERGRAAGVSIKPKPDGPDP
jgi:DNA-binding response OmpR family regulator